MEHEVLTTGDYDPVSFGRTLRLLRERKALSIRALADLAGVDKSTVVRAELGRTTRPSVRERLCRALGTWPDWVEASAAEQGPCFSIHRKGLGDWVLVGGERRFGRHRLRDDAFETLEERSRLGEIGFAQRFYKRLLCNPPDRSLSAGMMELYRRDDPPTSHDGTEFIYCLRGSVRIGFPTCSFTLSEGEAATFDANVPHTYEPADEPMNFNSPPLLLYVMLGQ